jgi:hypothetical protein
MNELTPYNQPMMIREDSDPLSVFRGSALEDISPETMHELRQIAFEANALEALTPAIENYARGNSQQVLLAVQRGADSAEADFELEAISGHCTCNFFFCTCSSRHITVRGRTRFRAHFPNQR